MDLDALKQTAIEAALAAGEVAKRGFGQTKHVATKSNATDLVTEFDRQAQKVILDIVRARYPDHDILAEEGDSKQTGSPFLWAVDPIDGTTNFVHNVPLFCVSICVLHEQQPLVAVVWAPCLEELFVAVRGQGATCNGERLHVSNTTTLEQSVMATGFSYRHALRQQNLNPFNHFVLNSRAVRRIGSAALDLCWVGMGRFDGYWELDLNPWDVAAGWLVVLEAGGQLSDLEGQPLRVQQGGLVASNAMLHGAMLELLKQEG